MARRDLSGAAPTTTSLGEVWLTGPGHPPRAYPNPALEQITALATHLGIIPTITLGILTDFAT
jgi:hypothetical protein